MRRGCIKACCAAALVAAGLIPKPAEAACSPLSLCSCTATATGVSFGNYNALSPSGTNSTGTVRVRCTLLVALGGSYTISLSTGSSGNYARRVLRNGASSLGYNLFTDANRTIIWGDDTGGSSSMTRSFSALLLIDQTTTVYARIPSGQNVPSGVYSDSIIVTITY